jgi:hypothetical protein
MASGDLIGLYPNPMIGIGAITASKIASGVIPTTLPPSGNAGGDLSGTYPNPSIGTNKITTSKLADGSVTLTKLSGIGASQGNTMIWNGSQWTFIPYIRDSLLFFRESRSNQFPNSTIPSHIFTPKGVEENIDIVLSPKGIGSFLGNNPDNTVVGGAKRGNKSVDLQLSRTETFHVASGNNSTIMAGSNNVASGNNSGVLSGEYNNAEGLGSIVLGGYNNQATGQYSLSGAGYGNSAIGANSTAFGINNVASNVSTLALGGANNYSGGQYSAVIGGNFNYIPGSNGIALGTYNSNISGSRNVIIGGQHNSISTSNSIILGGSGITLSSNAENTIATLGNNTIGNRNMTINSPNTIVLGNMDIWLASNDGIAHGLYFFEPGTGSGTYPGQNNHTMFKAGMQQHNITYTLPLSSPQNEHQLLRVNASGQMSWGNSLITQQSISVDCPTLNPNGGIGYCDVTVSGTNVGGVVHVSPTEDLVAGISIASVRITQSNTVRIAFLNATGSSINPAPIPFNIAIIQ